MSRTGQCNVCGEVRKLEKHRRRCHPCSYQARKSRLQNRCKECNKLVSLNCTTGLCKSCGRKGILSPQWKGGTRIGESGYRLLLIPDHPHAHKSGYVLEHIVVMCQHLGRALSPGENVHHRNGIRDGNRLENLELWSRSQPAGQRVVDKVAWAKEILALYGPDYADGAPPPPPAPDRNEAAKALMDAVGELLGLAERLDSLAEEVR